MDVKDKHTCNTTGKICGRAARDRTLVHVVH